MSRKSLFLFGILLATFIIYSRQIFRFPFLYSWDSVQFALSIKEYDVSIHQPHPPGYIFYSAILKAVDYFINDPNVTLIALNIAFTVIGCFFLFLLVFQSLQNIDLKTRLLLSCGAAVLYATNPINWFYGCVAEIYAVEGGLVSVLLYLLSVSLSKPRLMLITSLAFGIVGGIRLTTEIFLIPAYIYVMLKADRRTIMHSILVILFSNIAWMIPTAELSGGVDRYLNVVLHQAKRESIRTAGFHSEIALDILLSIIQGITLPILMLLIVRINKVRFDSKKKLLLIASLPALIFFLFIHYPKHGYLLYVLPVIIALSVSVLRNLVKSYRLQFAILCLSVVMNYLIFVKPPIYTTNEIQTDPVKRIVFKFTFPNNHTKAVEEHRLKSFFEKISELGNRKKLFIMQNGYWPDWRTIMYYYPNDTSVLLLPKKRASVAEKHTIRNIRQPIYLNGDERLIITIGSKPTEAQLNDFEVGEFRFFYGFLRHFPKGFRLYAFQFFKTQEP